MANSSNSGNRRRPDRQWLWKVLSGVSITLSSLTVAGMVGTVFWVNHFAREELAPLVEASLSEELDRPVKLGRVERVSLSGLRFGPSVIPATPQEPERLNIAAIEVDYNLLRFLTEQAVYLQLRVIGADIYLQQRKDGSWLPELVTEEEEEPGLVTVRVESVKLQNSKVALAPNPEAGKQRPVIQLSQVNGEVAIAYQGGGQEVRLNLTAQMVKGGNADIQAVVTPGAIETRAQIRGRNLSAADVSRLLPLPIDLRAGRLDADLEIKVDRGNEPSLFGTVDFKALTLTAPGLPRPLTGTFGQLQFQGQQIQFKNVRTTYAQIPLQVEGGLNLKTGFDLMVRVQPTRIAVLLDAFTVKLPVPVMGEIRADLRIGGPLDAPRVAGVAQSTQPARINGVEFKQIQTRFELNQPVLYVRSLRALPASGGEIQGKGQVNLASGAIAFNLQADEIPGDAVARDLGVAPGVKIGAVSAIVTVSGLATRPQIYARWRAPQAAYPGSGELIMAGSQILLRNTVLRVAGGTVRAEGVIAEGRFRAIVEASQIQLQQLAKGQRGLASGRVNLTGDLAQFSAAKVRATGQVRLSEGIAPLRGPLVAAFRWDGQKLFLDRATAPDFSADGIIYARLQGAGAPTVTALNLNVRATDYDLRELAAALPNTPLPDNFSFSGRGSFNGKVTGTLNNPSVVGTLRLNNLVVNQVAFDPVLRGTVKYSGTAGADLQLAGKNDRIALNVDRNFQPQSFYLKRDRAIAAGQAQGDILRVKIENFPIALVNPPTPPGLGPAKGEVTGTFDVNLAQRTAKGQATITNLALGNISAREVSGTFNVDLARQTALGTVTILKPTFNALSGDKFQGQIRYADGVATLIGGELQRGESRYALDGSLTLGADPQFKGKFKVAQGNLQDLFESLQWFEISDLLRGAQAPTYNRAAEVQPVPVGKTDDPLLTQLKRVSEIQTLFQQQLAQRNAQLLPKLSDVTGTYSGEVEFSGSRRTGIEANFDIQGQNWGWGKRYYSEGEKLRSDYRYFAEKAVLKGSFNQQGLTLLPLRFQAGETVLAFTGQVGLERQAGQLRVENLPVEALQDFVAVPLNITGKINGNATLAGNLLNPQVVGELNLDEGTLNGTPVQSARTGFNFNEDRLSFGTTVIVQGPEPIQVTGSLPIDLPFTLVAPETEEISLDINVKNEGLALLNLLNNQVAWVNGTGELNLQVRGTLDQPLATGTARVENATFKVQALPEPLTKVNGTIRFDRDRIVLEDKGIQALFSDGQVVAQGILPISARFRSSDSAQAEALMVTMNNLDLNLKGLYRGEVDGNVEITGALLNPQVGGTIRLTRGQVLLPDETAVQRDEIQDIDLGDESELTSPPEFNNLTLVLGDNVLITQQPILRFLATGELILNGPLDDLSPKGKIRLVAGQVNIFTTTFNLAGGYEHTATFTPKDGLNPTLDVRLITSVPEVVRQRVRSSTSIFASNETEDVPATSLGALQTVRIQARVQGSARRIFDNLELTSSPARTQTEIIALLGGSFVNTLGRGDSTLALANLAGSALLTQIQNVIGNAIGFSEFRLFPTVITSKDSRTPSDASALGLAAEIGIDITSNLSLSVLRILTVDQPTQFGLRYQLNDQLRVRGSTDFSGDNRGVVEYETRF
ncbi:hypothetical protein BST81_15615 [Leptolyngbya sp. 'hensonii']|uniref:translocation/assembly module TamB domain-containing protein n=1 Tax=Leptolyngbya sp. 'hensonii' TaxID=1922337 RepID=UPI0009501B2D|nr:translocation/assembly module TamB domain-containing protein [Leptolyngbya sp. 'hensonii']OLP17744.1 hypothetical protein BST81_15615 [Leptolyngbya sp. 'hensonii']